MEYVLEEIKDYSNPYDGRDFDGYLESIARERGKTLEEMTQEISYEDFDALLSNYTKNKEKMKLDASRAFAMKAYNRSYTLQFSMDNGNGMTTITAVDMETPAMSFFQRLKLATDIIFGKTNIGDLVFPLRVRNNDFYHMSYLYRPEKKVEVKAQPQPAVEPEAPAKPKTRKPGRPRSKKTKDSAA